MAAADTGTDLLLASYAAAVSYFWLGDLATARAHGEHVLNHYDFERHQHLVHSTNHDPKVVVLLYTAQWLWILGWPDQAVQASEAKDRLARQLDHPFNLAFALAWGAGVFAYRREPEPLLQQTDEAITIGTEQRIPVIHAIVGPFWQAPALLEEGRFAECVAMLRSAIAAWCDMGGQLHVPFCTGMMADALGRMGQVEEGLALIDEALSQADRNSERVHEAELWRIKGELLLKQARTEPSAAVTCFQKAIAIARPQEAKSWELRTATSLARLWQSQDKRQDAIDLLAPVYGWFTEGFDTADLIDAKVLLDELS